MGVNQAVSVKRGKWSVEKKRVAAAKLRDNLICAGLGLLFGLAGFSNGFSPFGIAFAASLSGGFSLAAAIGSVLGWFLTLESVDALRYMASVLAVCVIKNATKAFPRICESRAEAVAVSFGCIFVTGFATAFAEGLTLYSVLFFLAESAVGAAGALLFFKVKAAKAVKGGISALSGGEVTGICICLMLLLLGLKSINVFGIYPAHIACGLLVLICGYYNREAGGSISGVCAGIAMSLGGETPYLLGIFSFGGLAAGVFSQFGKIVCIIAYALSGTVFLALGAGALKISSIIIETIITLALFFIVTRLFGKNLERLLKPAKAEPVTDGVKSEIFKKLKNASEISAEICSSLTDVNEALAKSEKSDIANVSKKAKERICGSCGLYDNCWGENLSATQDCFNTLLNLKKEGVYLEYKTAPVQFAAHCIRTESVAACFNKLYSEYAIRRKNESRLREMHSLASEQFINVSSLLDSLCESLTDKVTFDSVLASRIISTAHFCGFRGADCTCAISSSGKMTVEIKIKNSGMKGELSQLNKRLNALCGRKFELPVLERKDLYTLIIYKEKAELRVVSASAQFCADGEKFSGDSFSMFEDSNGVFYAVICDGMGTGAKAALSSSLAVMLFEKLIKAGFGIEAAVNTVNTSLISKTGDECSVTLDLVAIDLFSGYTRFYKCGASESLIRRKGKIIDVSMPSLPMGIISNIEAGSSGGALGAGDCIVMASDGASDEKGVLRKNLRAVTSEKLKAFTAEKSNEIREHQIGKRDDMTMITLFIEEND